VLAIAEVNSCDRNICNQVFIFGLTVQTLYKPLCKQPPLFLEKTSAACLPLQRFGGFNSCLKLLLVVFIASMALEICLLYPNLIALVTSSIYLR
jgi:hypothetical protein